MKLSPVRIVAGRMNYMLRLDIPDEELVDTRPNQTWTATRLSREILAGPQVFPAAWENISGPYSFWFLWIIKLRDTRVLYQP